MDTHTKEDKMEERDDGGKARKRRRRKVCFEWSKTKSCKYGHACKFEHLRESQVKVIDDKDQKKVVYRCETSTTLVSSASTTPLKAEHVAGNEIHRPRPPEERYFEHFYVLKENENGEYEDIYVHRHSNGICVVGLAPTHAALDKSKRTVVSTKYTSDRLGSMEISGRKKSGAAVLNKDQVVCVLHCNDGNAYTIRASIKARLFEINDEVVKDPRLFNDSSGYILIGFQKKEDVDEMRNDSCGFYSSRKTYIDQRAHVLF